MVNLMQQLARDALVNIEERKIRKKEFKKEIKKEARERVNRTEAKQIKVKPDKFGRGQFKKVKLKLGKSIY